MCFYIHSYRACCEIIIPLETSVSIGSRPVFAYNFTYPLVTRLFQSRLILQKSVTRRNAPQTDPISVGPVNVAPWSTRQSSRDDLRIERGKGERTNQRTNNRGAASEEDGNPVKKKRKKNERTEARSLSAYTTRERNGTKGARTTVNLAAIDTCEMRRPGYTGVLML